MLNVPMNTLLMKFKNWKFYVYILNILHLLTNKERANLNHQTILEFTFKTIPFHTLYFYL